MPTVCMVPNDYAMSAGSLEVYAIQPVGDPGAGRRDY
jgi:hypothetical protein